MLSQTLLQEYDSVKNFILIQRTFIILFAVKYTPQNQEFKPTNHLLHSNLVFRWDEGNEIEWKEI